MTLPIPPTTVPETKETPIKSKSFPTYLIKDEFPYSKTKYLSIYKSVNPFVQFKPTGIVVARVIRLTLWYTWFIDTLPETSESKLENETSADDSALPWFLAADRQKPVEDESQQLRLDAPEDLFSPVWIHGFNYNR